MERWISALSKYVGKHRSYVFVEYEGDFRH
jgi:hypothetical protein